MNLLELKQAVEWALERCQNPEQVTVYIPSYKTGTAGHMPATSVKSAHMGIDWEANSFLITPEKQLREIDRDEMKALRDKYEELSWSYYKVSKVKKENEALKAELKKIKDGNSL